MHATAEQQGTHSPKTVNSATATSPLKHGPDSMQNSSTFPSRSKGKKRDRSDKNSESTRREHFIKHYDGDSGQLRSENLLKSEIAKLTQKGLIDSDSVERLLQLMQPEKSNRKVDLSCRSMLAGIIAATERLECLNQFVQRRGLPVLDEWLQEVRKGKVGSSTTKDGDRSVEDFLLVLLRALDKLPVDLNALQMCNIGKSVNHLRSHKSLEIQKKARSLVDTWKQRVEAEMNINDAKSSSSQTVPWPTRSKHEASDGGKRHLSGSSEAVTKTSGTLASPKSTSVKLAQGETAGKASSASSGIEKSSSPPMLTNANLKEGQLKMSAVGGCSESQITAREEKSSSSSQSHTNSHCSSDRPRKYGKEDPRSSTAGSSSMNKTNGASRNSAYGLQAMTPSVAKKESGTSKCSSSSRSSAPAKVSQSTITCENAPAMPVAESNSHKIIVKIQNQGCSPQQRATEGSMDELCTNSKASSPADPEKNDQADASLRKKISNCLTNEVDALPEGKQSGTAIDTAKSPDIPKGTSDTGKDSRLLDSSLNALIESCEKYSEADTSVPVGDNSGMNLLASVAAEEMSTIGNVSLSVPPLSTASADSLSTDYQGTTLSTDAELSRFSSISCADLFQKIQPSTKTNGELDVFVGEASMSTSPAGIVERGICDGSEQIHLKAASIKGEKILVRNARVAAAGSLGAEHVAKDEIPFAKTGDIPLPRVSKHDDEWNKANQLPSSSVSIEYKQPSLTYCSESKNTKENEGLVPNSAGADEGFVQNTAKLKAENTYEVDASGPVDADLKQRDENDAFCNPHKEESGFVFANSDKKTDSQGDKEAFVHCSGGSTTKLTLSSSGELEPQLNSKNSDVIASKEEQNDKDLTGADAASVSAAGVTDLDKKLEFDLNEGFNMDDMKNGEPVGFVAASSPTSASLPNPSCPSVSLASDCIPGPVTVAAAAAKGPFVPPEDLLRNKTELGWRGSAATSAFRPAEPRKVLETSTSSSKIPPHDAMACKQVRPFLEIDLNVTDERILQDISSQNSSLKISHKFDHKNKSNGEFMGSASLHSSGGFEFDLNRVDEVSELGQQLAGNSQGLEVSSLPVQSSSSSRASNVEASTKREFDLNNGPSMDEMTFEPLVNQQAYSNISQPHFGLRMNNATVSNMSSWCSPGTAYSAVTVPAPLADREQPFSIVTAGGPQRILSGSSSGTSFNPDFYRGSVLSSPAVAFAATHYQYPLLPFGTSFSVATSSFPGSSVAYMNPSSAARFSAPVSAAQLTGKAAAVSSQYPRLCGVPVPNVGNNSVGESNQKWVRQGLDLNSCPGDLDVEGRDEALHLSSRQFSSLSFQGLADEQANTYEGSGGIMKRKEPDGGWYTDRNNYKQSS